MLTATYGSSEWTAWLAGLIEGEGSVLIARITSRVGYRRGMSYAPTIQISNTDSALMDRAADVIEALTGSRPRRCPLRRQNEKHKLGWQFQIRASWKALILLPLLMPYLIAKRKQAEIVLEFSKRHAGRAGRWRDDETFRLDEIDYAKCRVLNHRGNHGGPAIEDLERMLQLSEERKEG